MGGTRHRARALGCAVLLTATMTTAIGHARTADAAVHSAAPPLASLAVEESATPATYSAPGQAIHYTFTVTNTGSVTLVGVHVSDDRFVVVACPQSTLAPGERQTCTATYRTTQQDVDRGSIHDTARAQGGTPGSTMPVLSDPSAVTERAVRKPAITVRKSVRPKYFSHSGQVLHYAFRVTNTGNVTLNRVRINDYKGGLSRIRCPRTTLAPNAAMTCTATYRITKADMRKRAVRNRAVAQGRPAGATTPVRSKASIVWAYGHAQVTG